MKVGTDAMLLGALVESSEKFRALDVGSGTGVLSLMLAQKNPELIIDAVELDAESAEECALNFKNSPWNHRLNVVNSDFLEFDTSEKYDLIVSNPPYYQTTLVNQNQRKAAARHSESLPVPSFVLKASNYLSDSGNFWLIIPSENKKTWEDEARANGLFLNQSILIFGKRGGILKRCIIQFSLTPKECRTSTLFIRDASGDYTEDYRQLTKDFHGKPI